jgi:hypothetical protein
MKNLISMMTTLQLQYMFTTAVEGSTTGIDTGAVDTGKFRVFALSRYPLMLLQLTHGILQIVFQ